MREQQDNRNITRRTVMNGRRCVPVVFLIAVLLIALPFFAIGCGAVPTFWPKNAVPASQGGRSPLRDIRSNANAAGVELFIIRVPYAERAALQSLWREADDLAFPVLLRRDLLDNGIRVAVLGVNMSPALSKLLGLKSPENVELASLDPSGIAVDQRITEPLSRRQSIQLQPGMRSLIAPYMDRLPEIPIFESDRGRISGRSYRDALGYLAVTATPLNDGHVHFQLIPELEFGDVQTQLPIIGGAIVPTARKPTKAFENLTVSARLLPGQWLLIGPASELPTGIGRYFFTRAIGDTEQKLVAIRLASTPKDGVFNGNDHGNESWTDP